MNAEKHRGIHADAVYTLPDLCEWLGCSRSSLERNILPRIVQFRAGNIRLIPGRAIIQMVNMEAERQNKE